MNLTRQATWWIATLAVAMIHASFSVAHGVIRVVRYSLSEVPESNPAEYNSGTNFTVELGNNHSYVRIYSTSPSQENIGRITIGGSGSNVVGVVLGNQAWDDNGVVFAACVDWAGVITNRGHTKFIGRISGNLTDTVSAGQLFRLSVGGQIQRGVQANIAEGTFVVTASSITAPDGNITAAAGDIGLVQIAGNIAGPIEATAGDINTITTTSSGSLLASVSAPLGQISTINIAGTIGASGSLSIITAKDGIGTITARAIYADITANDGAAGTYSASRQTTRISIRAYTPALSRANSMQTRSRTPQASPAWRSTAYAAP